MTNKTAKIQRISLSKRKDPLIDLTSLERIAKSATKIARERAFRSGATITIAQQGKVYRVYSDGKKELIRTNKSAELFPRIEDDLCRA